MQGQACLPLKSELIVFNNVRFKKFISSVAALENIAQAGQVGCFWGPRWLSRKKHWPNPLSLSGPTDTRESRDSMVL